ncbi:SDR family oxidoreductase [Streptomyces sp. NPDC021100]|uniref:SDR family oxidoreductase n=1 Tax=Streptomyces sp. NPDC021100 TaxID=3365114 RepID=UPI0037A0649A
MLTAITGGTGFLGVHLVRELLLRGHRLLLLARPHPVPAHVRVERFLRASSSGEHEIRRASALLETVETELTRPLLGLGRERFQRLADRIDALWHCAGEISFSATLEEVRKVNVTGTRHVLQLLTRGERAPVLYHCSTVAVAGARPSGVVREEIPDDSFGFNSPYEQSKFEAEGLVRRWVEEHGGRAVIVRPSGLITHRPACPERPDHPLRTYVRALAAVLRLHPELASRGEPLVFPAAPGARVNLLPVEYAAYAMAELPSRCPPADLLIYHLVNRHYLPVTDLATVLSDHFGIPVRLHPRLHGPVTPEAREYARLLPMYAAWHTISRTYDDRNLTDLGLAYPGQPPIDKDYLALALR